MKKIKYDKIKLEELKRLCYEALYISNYIEDNQVVEDDDIENQLLTLKIRRNHGTRIQTIIDELINTTENEIAKIKY